MKRIPLNMATMKAIDAIYAKIPKINCQRKCHDYCCQVLMTDFEYQRIVNKTGRNPPRPVSLTEACGWLKNGLCKVREIRPTICRLWGVVDHPMMRCEHGCVPERWLTDEEATAIILEIDALGNRDVSTGQDSEIPKERRSPSALNRLLHATNAPLESVPGGRVRIPGRLSPRVLPVDVLGAAANPVGDEEPGQVSIRDGVLETDQG